MQNKADKLHIELARVIHRAFFGCPASLHLQASSLALIARTSRLAAAWGLHSARRSVQRPLLDSHGVERLAASAFSAVKRIVRCRSGLQNAHHASNNMLAGAFLRHHPGITSLGQAVQAFLHKRVDKSDPSTYGTVTDQDAFDATSAVQG